MSHSGYKFPTDELKVVSPENHPLVVGEIPLYWPYPLLFSTNISETESEFIFLKDDSLSLAKFLKSNKPNEITAKIIVERSCLSVTPKNWQDEVLSFYIEDSRPKAENDYLINENLDKLQDEKDLSRFNLICNSDHSTQGINSALLLGVYKLGHFSNVLKNQNIVTTLALTPFHKLFIYQPCWSD